MQIFYFLKTIKKLNELFYVVLYTVLKIACLLILDKDKKWNVKSKRQTVFKSSSAKVHKQK